MQDFVAQSREDKPAVFVICWVRCGSWSPEWINWVNMKGAAVPEKKQVSSLFRDQVSDLFAL